MTTNDANQTSLLARIAGKFAYHPENVATDALGHILRYEGALRILGLTLLDGGVDVGDLAQVRTQAGQKGGRPDLAVLDSGGYERALIEAKFWAGLTANQPSAYLERLAVTGKTSALLFVSPESRQETLWSELLRAARIEDPGEEAAGITRVRVHGTKTSLMLVSWNDLLRKLREVGAYEDINQLEGLCRQESGDSFPPLRDEQMGPEAPRMMLYLNKLIEAATANAGLKGYLTTENLRAAPGMVGFGKNMLLGGATAWLGVNYHFWAKISETPLWIVFIEKKGNATLTLHEVYEKLTPLREKQPPEAFALLDRRQCVPVYLPTGAQRSATVEAIVDRLGEIADLIGPKRRGRPRKNARPSAS